MLVLLALYVLDGISASRIPAKNWDTGTYLPGSAFWRHPQTSAGKEHLSDA